MPITWEAIAVLAAMAAFVTTMAATAQFFLLSCLGCVATFFLLALAIYVRDMDPFE